MRLRLLLLAVAPIAAFALTQPASAQRAAVCDPVSILHCVKPNADGSINVDFLGAALSIDQTTPGATNGVQTLSGSVTSATGNVANGSTDSGNPVETGCNYTTAPTAVSTGQRVVSACSAYGDLHVQRYLPFTESTANLAAGASIGGASRSPALAGAWWADYFSCSAVVVGAVGTVTLYLDHSFAGVNVPITSKTATGSAGGVYLEVNAPVTPGGTGQFCTFANGASAATTSFELDSSFRVGP